MTSQIMFDIAVTLYICVREFWPTGKSWRKIDPVELPGYLNVTRRRIAMQKVGHWLIKKSTEGKPHANA